MIMSHQGHQVAICSRQREANWAGSKISKNTVFANKDPAGRLGAVDAILGLPFNLLLFVVIDNLFVQECLDVWLNQDWLAAFRWITVLVGGSRPKQIDQAATAAIMTACEASRIIKSEILHANKASSMNQSPDILASEYPQRLRSRVALEVRIRSTELGCSIIVNVPGLGRWYKKEGRKLVNEVCKDLDHDDAPK